MFERIMWALLLFVTAMAFAACLDIAFAETVTEPGIVVSRRICPGTASTCPIERSKNPSQCFITVELADGSRWEVYAWGDADQHLRIGDQVRVRFEEGWLSGWRSGERLAR